MIYLIAAALALWISASTAARQWISRSWRNDQISDRQAASLLGSMSFAPLIVAVSIVIALRPEGTPPLTFGFLGGALLIVGSLIAAAEYMNSRSIKQRVRQNRAERTG